MIKVENVSVYNIARAIYSARNAMNSWAKSDSEFDSDKIGPNDLLLAQRLCQAGPEHRKFLRQIFVTMDITGPIYWISELDTYKVGTSRNSCSFQHKGTAKEFTLDDFTIDENMPKEELEAMIVTLNKYRSLYLATQDYKYFRLIRQLLPSGYNQKFTLTMSYENVVTMIHQRGNHRLKEWHDFCDELKKLPYIREIIGE